jgi:hypothetical protein
MEQNVEGLSLYTHVPRTLSCSKGQAPSLGKRSFRRKMLSHFYVPSVIKLLEQTVGKPTLAFY